MPVYEIEFNACRSHLCRFWIGMYIHKHIYIYIYICIHWPQVQAEQALQNVINMYVCVCVSIHVYYVIGVHTHIVLIRSMYIYIYMSIHIYYIIGIHTHTVLTCIEWPQEQAEQAVENMIEEKRKAEEEAARIAAEKAEEQRILKIRCVK
jgi:hypothetical protein